MLKRVGAPIGVSMTVQHRGQAITGWAWFMVSPGSPSSLATAPTSYVLIGKIPVAFLADSDWTDYDISMSGVYPDLLYEAGYNKADAGIAILNQAEDQVLAGALYYDDVYELAAATPTPDPLPEPQNTNYIPLVIVGGILAGFWALHKKRKRGIK